MKESKQMAMNFLQLAGYGKVKEAFEKYIDDNFIHHNQYSKGDRQSLLNAMEEAHQTQPNKKVTTLFCYDDKDSETVITHSHVVKENADIAVVHIFRFKRGKVVELWDVGMMIQKDSPNEHGVF